LCRKEFQDGIKPKLLAAKNYLITYNFQLTFCKFKPEHL
jgi:hypothetical protein